MEHTSAVSLLEPHFRFPFKGEQVAGRFLVGCALLLASFIVPILPALFPLGYGVQVMRRAASGEPPRLHAWGDWGRLLSDGFRAWVLSLVFFLPGILITVGGYVAYFASFLTMSGYSGTESDAAYLSALLIGTASLFGGLGLGFLLFLVASIFFPVALSHLAFEDRFATAFHFRAWWRVLRANSLGFLIAWVIVTGLAGAAYFLSALAYVTLVLICFLPVLLVPAFFYVMLVGAAVFGDVYAQGRARLAVKSA